MEKRQTILGVAIAAVILLLAAVGVMRMRGKEEQVVHEGATQGHASKSAKSAKPKSKPARHVPYREVPKSDDPLACKDCNVIIVAIDALRADHLSSYGYGRKTSPKLDKMANHGILFEDAISQSSWDAPAYASMFTGVLPREHGLVYYPSPGTLAKDTPTLAGRLTAAGYQTVSWNGAQDKAPSLATGFEHAYAKSRSFGANFGAARKWLADHGDKKFFMFVTGNDVRLPYVKDKYNTFYKPKQKYDMKEFCKLDTQPREGDELDYIVAQYDAGIASADKSFGVFYKFLEEQKLLDNTILIVTAPNGEELFDHGQCDHKQSVYRELVHVPLIVHVPSKHKARVADTVAASTSLEPTVLGMLGLLDKNDKTVDASLDLRPVITGKGGQKAVISETGATRPRAPDEGAGPDVFAYYRTSVTTPDAKLIYSKVGDAETWQLFEKPDFAHEKDDVATKQAATVKKLRALLFPPKGDARVPKPSVAPAPATATPPTAANTDKPTK